MILCVCMCLYNDYGYMYLCVLFIGWYTKHTSPNLTPLLVDLNPVRLLKHGTSLCRTSSSRILYRYGDICLDGFSDRVLAALH